MNDGTNFGSSSAGVLNEALAQDHTEPMCVDKNTLSTEELVAFFYGGRSRTRPPHHHFKLGAIPMEQ